MFEVTFTVTALVESNDQGQHAFRVLKHAEPVNDDGFLALVATIYEQDVSRVLRAGDDLRIFVHLDLPPREIEKMLRFREDGQFEGEGMAEPTRDLDSLIKSIFEYYRPHVHAGDVLTLSFRVQRP